MQWAFYILPLNYPRRVLSCCKLSSAVENKIQKVVKLINFISQNLQLGTGSWNNFRRNLCTFLRLTTSQRCRMAEQRVCSLFCCLFLKILIIEEIQIFLSECLLRSRKYIWHRKIFLQPLFWQTLLGILISWT